MRYLFCSLNTYGYLFGSLGIAQALKRRGHEVVFVANPAQEQLISRAGFSRLGKDNDARSFTVEQAGYPMDLLIEERHLEWALKQFEADVVVGQQLTLSAYVAAERLGKPVATIGMGSLLWPTETPPEDERLRQYVAKRFRGFYLAYAAVREMCGMPQRPFSVQDNPMLGDLFLLRSVPELEGDPSELPPQVHLVGDCLWEPPPVPDSELERWLEEAKASGEPVIYAQPGRSFNTRSFWGDLLEAFSGQPVRVVASVGRMDGQAGEVPKNFFVRPHVPQLRVLQQARAVICSATTTAVLGGLTRGLPLLLIPGGGGAEQMDLTQRCEKAQVAIRLPASKVTPELLRGSMNELLAEGAYPSRAAAMREAFQRAGGPEYAAELLEELGRRKAPVLRSPQARAATVG